ncbi:hypothetical protein [Psychrobacter sp. DAB_AL43B]|uniref:hypothetical protein n=1 Tax=Psychrobacter sp. DAB_AL43B TaxID=1028416 RepID=UPI0009A5BC6C|nr:hypothetical protein [Psychrobacter sp. DAB_AL43B]SLJ83446.1 hypothetical protein DABAL43B_0228 [Psychrobacter sp. DAB_AL43B]
MKKDSFLFGDVMFRWGDKLSDIKAQLPEKDTVTRSYEESYMPETVTIKLSEIWSLKVAYCHFSAADDDRLIDSIWINIPAQLFNRQPVIKKLIAYLGPGSNYSSDSQYYSGNVVEHCEWIFDNCVIGVSMYGGVREEDNEKIIGSLSISLSDVELLDSLYSKPIRDMESKMADQVDISTIKSFQTQQAQSMRRSREREEFPDHPAAFVIRAFDGLHKETLFQTPLVIQSVITESEVCTWKSKVGDYYLSNYWQTVKLEDDMSSKWTNLLPTKSPGVCYVSIGGLLIIDENSRPETKVFVKHIEKIIKSKIEYHETYDC